jgi:hypothetical protein
MYYAMLIILLHTYMRISLSTKQQVSLFLQHNVQNNDATLVLNMKGPLPRGAQVSFEKNTYNHYM